MTKEIIKLYEDFFNTIEKDKISYIYKAYPKVDEVFNNIINNLEYTPVLCNREDCLGCVEELIRRS